MSILLLCQAHGFENILTFFCNCYVKCLAMIGQLMFSSRKSEDADIPITGSVASGRLQLRLINLKYLVSFKYVYYLYCVVLDRPNLRCPTNYIRTTVQPFHLPFH